MGRQLTACPQIHYNLIAYLATMPTEIERKFLVDAAKWQALSKPTGTYIRQGYILNKHPKSLRVRIEGDQSTLNLKQMTDALHRYEFEYTIPLEDAHAMLNHMAESEIEKTRYKIPAGPFTWEVDVFCGANEGLIIAEIELPHANEAFDKPAWVGDEVTHDMRYLNTAMAERPFTTWNK